METPDLRSTYRDHFRFGALLLALAVFFIYGRLCKSEFTWWDDQMTLFQNPHLNPPSWESLSYYFSHVEYGLYVPITYLAWLGLALIAHVNQPDDLNISLNPWVFHSANVLLHVGTTIVVFALLRRLVKRDAAALLGAMLYGLHPIQLEAVAWASGLKDVLCGLLTMIALLRYVIRAQRDDVPQSFWRCDPWGTVALIAAMLAKPSAMMTPAIALIIDLLLLRRPLRTVLKSTALWFAIALPIAILARLAQGVAGIPAAPMWSRPLIAGDSIAFYLFKFAWPIKLAPDYGRSWPLVIAQRWLYFSWLLPATLGLLSVRLLKPAPWIAAGACVFVLAILPVSGLATFEFQMYSDVADHYLYVAMLGAAIALASALARWSGKVCFALAAVWIAALSLRTTTLAPVWHDTFSLFRHTLTVNPNSVVAYNNIGAAYAQQNMPRESLPYYYKAMALNQEIPTAFENAAGALAYLGNVDESIRIIDQSIAIRARLPRTMYPNYMEDYNRVGQVLLARGRYAEAIERFEKLLAIKPDHVEAKKFLAQAQTKLAAQSATQPTKKSTPTSTAVPDF